MTYSACQPRDRSAAPLKIAFLIASLLLLPLVTSTGQAAMQIFMISDQIQGESKDPTFPGAIEIQGIQWGSSLTTPSGGGPGAASFSDITVTKGVDSATPEFFMELTQGGVLGITTLVFRRTGVDPLDYFAIRLFNVRITSIDIFAESSAAAVTEQVTMDYGKIEFFYRITDENGKPGGIKSTCYDLQANQDC